MKAIRNWIGFKLMAIGHRMLEPNVGALVGLTAIVGKAWLSENPQEAMAILTGGRPIPGIDSKLIEHEPIGFFGPTVH